MIKVITYGTYDMLHYGHIRLLERAKALGDYLIVGVTADDFDKSRGKINVEQSLMERVEAVRQTGLADEIIIEEYEGQKIDDIIRYNIDIFAVGSDWVGHFDYLEEYCKVIYLERTKGISSSDLREKKSLLRIGIIGDGESTSIKKYCSECSYVNGAVVSGICTINPAVRSQFAESSIEFTENYDALLEMSDAVCIISHPTRHYAQAMKALKAGKHVLCQAPIALNPDQCDELFQVAEDHGVILMEALKTAYCTAYDRLLLLVKGGAIGKVVSVDATCTSIRNVSKDLDEYRHVWNSICAWGPTALLPVFQTLGTDYSSLRITSLFLNENDKFDLFSKVDLTFDNAVASIKVGRGVKSEGELVISGTSGYIYVPAPWWKTDYFEVRYENTSDNRRYFYQLDGEGIRYELVAFLRAVSTGKRTTHINTQVTKATSKVLAEFFAGNVNVIS